MTSVYSTTAWLEARQKALDRDEVCQDCGTSKELHVHHITPVREFDEPLESHDLDNLVVLCERCHPKWEGRGEVPNLLDEETKLKKSELVYDLSRNTIDAIAPDPAPRDVEEYFASQYPQNPHRCGYCYSPLPRTRGEMLRRSKAGRDGHLCPSCGHLPHFWRNFDSGAPDVATMKERCELIVAGLSQNGIYLDATAMKAAVEAAWSKDEYFGEVELVTKFAIRMGARHSSSPVSEDKFRTPCPEPSPVEPV
ncbi:hypothetical protein OSG_eHP31_00155 [environmental Halophage eHP-31]|jgi:hypothetical protein|nr:hypothetical protein OSG_eHP31_00155 [environmental Halophage eHP-31]